MANEIFVRPMKKEEIEQFERWALLNSELSLLDPAIVAYPTLRVMAAENGRVIGYLPYHDVLMLESFAPDPEATDLERAEACRQFVKTVYSVASSAGVREIVYFGKDDRLNRVAERHGFEKIEFPVYRLKVK